MAEFIACPLGKLVDVTSTRCGTISGRGRTKKLLMAPLKIAPQDTDKTTKPAISYLRMATSDPAARAVTSVRTGAPPKCSEIDHNGFKPVRPDQYRRVLNGPKSMHDIFIDREYIAFQHLGSKFDQTEKNGSTGKKRDEKAAVPPMQI